MKNYVSILVYLSTICVIHLTFQLRVVENEAKVYFHHQELTV